METLFQLASPISAAAASALISAIWEGSVLAACVMVCLRLLPRLCAASRSMIWMNVFLLLVLLHFVPSMRAHAIDSGQVQASAIRLDLLWSVALAGLWGMLSVWRGTQLIVSAIRLRRLANRATPVRSTDQELLAVLKEQRGRRAELCTSVEVQRPSVFGFFRPRILVPPTLLERLSPQELKQVVLHEMEHLRRGDDWTNLLQKVGLAIFPLNPVLMWVERRLCAERELACDDRVLRSGGARKTYALCLTHLAEYSMLQRSLSLALGAWERRPELVRRIQRLLSRPPESMGGRQTALATAGLLLGVIVVAMSLAHSPQLVTFAPPGQSHDRSSRAQAFAARLVSVGATAPRRFAGSPQLVKAVMLQRPALSASIGKPLRNTARKVNAGPSQQQNVQAWVVLATWTEDETPPQIVFAVAQKNRSSFAAVPIANGWLIVQI